MKKSKAASLVVYVNGHLEAIKGKGSSKKIAQELKEKGEQRGINREEKDWVDRGAAKFREEVKRLQDHDKAVEATLRYMATDKRSPYSQVREKLAYMTEERDYYKELWEETEQEMKGCAHEIRVGSLLISLLEELGVIPQPSAEVR